VLQVGDTGCELEAQQCAQGEDMIGIAAAVGVVPADGDVALIEKLPIPSPNTVRRRLKALSLADMRRRGEEHPETKPVRGHAPPARYPLDPGQVDHTPMDLIVVNKIDIELNGRPWLAMREVTSNWPVQGKPRRLGVHNGSEFHSQAFERGCAQHGIAIEWRPPGWPHFDGVTEHGTAG